ncbi:MAG: hypothetical protein IJR38_07905, partial [Selenomonadaceae bacterium]|nr:hypothetical protein [Selenomonadaceae bacterium]
MNELQFIRRDPCEPRQRVSMQAQFLMNSPAETHSFSFGKNTNGVRLNQQFATMIYINIAQGKTQS